MHDRALIMLNMIEYTDIYLKKRSIEYAITEQLSRQMYSKHCHTFKIVRFAKRIMSECLSA